MRYSFQTKPETGHFTLLTILYLLSFMCYNGLIKFSSMVFKRHMHSNDETSI